MFPCLSIIVPIICFSDILVPSYVHSPSIYGGKAKLQELNHQDRIQVQFHRSCLVPVTWGTTVISFLKRKFFTLDLHVIQIWGSHTGNIKELSGLCFLNISATLILQQILAKLCRSKACENFLLSYTIKSVFCVFH